MLLNYLLVEFGRIRFEDVDVKFSLDFDPADDCGADLEGSYTIFGSFSEAFPLVEAQTGIDYGKRHLPGRQNFDFGFWSELAQGADVDFDPPRWCYNLGVYVYSLKAFVGLF